jgi:hypothetical protein
MVAYFPTSSVRGFLFSHILTNTCGWFLFLMVTILTGVNVVLICTSFMARDVEHFFMYFWPFGFLSLKILFAVHLPISSLGH